MENESSPALNAVAEMLRASRISKDEAEKLESKYRSLQEACALAREKERGLLKAMRRQQNDALSERLKVERARETFEAERAELETLDAERERVQKQLDDFEQKETVNKYETAELERTHGELLSSVEEMRKENDMLVKPELLKLEKDLANTQLVFKKVGDAFERDTQRKHMLIERSEMLEDDKQNCTLQLQEAKEFLQKVSVEPERIRKQAECVQKAGEKLQQEISRIVEQNKTYDREIRRQVSKRKEAEEVRNNLLHKLELHRDTISHRQRDVDAVKKNVDIEKARTHQLAELKIKLDINRKDMDDHMRHETDGMSMARKELEALRRRYRKKRTIADSANEILPTLKAQLADHEHLLRTHIDENKRCSIQIEGMKQEVDLAIARLLRQEVIEKSKRQGLESLLKEVAGMEDEIGNWSAEERRQNKLIAVLSAQREMKAREATRAQVAEKDTHEQVKVKELVILDLSKKCNEVNNRLKEFSALYDVVKNERNKYVSLIQSSSQALAEMKEKIKILMNEVEILRNESLAKDKALAKERSQHLASQAQRDGLRLELYKSQSEYRRKQEVVEQQIVEIDKLNSIINALERDMLRLKAQYVRAVELRNSTGVSLIDRNDELCILYEKVNLQEQTIKGGELGVRQKEEDIRMLKLQLVELQRQVVVSRKQLPQMPALADAVVRLKDELKVERQVTESLCKGLESPSNGGRWRALSGDDPDREQLLAKTAVLEERLNLKKEALLENELVLEEISNLTAKLRFRANEGRDSTLDIARKVNDFQAKIRETTRRMMATVSELSMYQATAMKLQQQKRAASTKLEESKWRIANNEAPADEVAYELGRRERARYTVRDSRVTSLHQNDQLVSGGVAGMVRTAAEPRPNAYIPDVAHGLGIPKPYSSLAPFKPTEAGSTMRHFRPPQPPVITL